MKKEFFDYLDILMEANHDIYIIFVGLGYPRVDEFIKKYGDRAINTEASEQSALDIAVGLAYAGKIPVVYTITPFLLRGFETIRTYINHEDLPVIMVGAGVGSDYAIHDGFSHEAGDIPKFLSLLKNIDIYVPSDAEKMKSNLSRSIQRKKPSFINIRR